VTRVLLADDNPQFRSALRRLLERDPEIVVLDEAENGQVAVEMAEELRPDVLLMDVSMPELDGIAATAEINERTPGVTVLLLSIGNKPQEVAAGLAAGAAEYLTKGSSAVEIVAAIKRHGVLTHQA
jgi:pilus assembly protein CpaE